jgi:hypothetical protein
MKKNFFLSILIASACVFTASAQKFSIGGSVGWAVPGGGGVSEAAADLNLDGGLTYTIDALYLVKPNLGVGLSYTGSVLAGAGEGDIDLFGMRVIGAKGRWALKSEGFTPYVGLTVGLAQLLTPELTITSGTQTTVVPENSGSGLGLMPEFGLSFGKFFLNAQYLVPTKYTIEEAQITDKAVGTFNIGLGYRYSF